MKKLPLRAALLAVVALIAIAAVAPAAAAEAPREPAPIVRQLRPLPNEGESSGGGSDVKPMVIWSIVTVLGGATVFGTLYLLKRRVGGFPQHPAWVAPITIMPSKDFADEGAYGDAPAGGHDSHH